MRRPRTERERILAGIRRLKEKIELDLNTIDHWNESVRKPGEDPIERDPDGILSSALAYCNGILDGEVELAPEDGQPPRPDRRRP